MIVLDASVLIAQFSEGDAHHQATRHLLRMRAASELLVHPITLAEVLVEPVRAGKLDLALTGILELEIGRWVPDDGEAVRLATLRVRTGLKLPDCCVLSAAMKNAAEVATVDGRLAAAARDLGLTVATG